MANRIAFGSFVFIGATGKSFVAKLYPKETCTCAVENAKCRHVVAFKLVLRMSVDDDDSYGQHYYVTKPMEEEAMQKTAKTWRYRRTSN